MLDELDIDIDAASQIKLTTMIYGVDTSLALNIACVESNFDESADNPRSTAEGVYEFLDGTWKHYGNKFWDSLEDKDKFDTRDNVELGVLVIRDYGTSDWNASKYSGFGGGWANKPYEKGLCSKQP
jgi:soluble lytic murein transglycosylase-like protein